MPVTRAWLVAAAAIIASATPARADMARAWTAAHAHLPDATAVVVAIDVATVASSTAFGGVLTLVLASQPDVQAGLSTIKALCKLDPATAVSGIVVAADATQQQGVIFLQLGGVEQPTVDACIDRVTLGVLGAKPDRRIARRRDGIVVERFIDPTYPEPLARPTGQNPAQPERLHVAWVSPGVLAIPLDIDNKATFVKWLTRRSTFKRTRLGRALATLDKRASIVAASAVPSHFTLPFAVKQGHAALTLGKSNVLADLRVVVESPAAATAAVELLHRQRKDVLARSKLSANVDGILRSALIGEREREVTISASVPESQMLELLLALAR